MTGKLVVEVDNISKRYRYRGSEKIALSNLSFSLSQGQILGLLGPNGAGKSTALRILTTLLKPDQGNAVIGGYDVLKQVRQVRQKIGYVPQAGTLMDESVVADEMILQGRCFGLDKTQSRSRACALLDQLGIPDLFNKKAGDLSGGQRRRVDIAMGLMNEPIIAFLDEPSVGLDPDARQELIDLILRIRDTRGTSFVVTTHYIEEAEQLADQITIIDGGIKIEEGTPHELSHKYALSTVTFTVFGMGIEKAVASIATFPDVASITWEHTENRRYLIRYRTNAAAELIPVVASFLESRKINIESVDMEKGSLNKAFLTITGKETAV